MSIRFNAEEVFAMAEQTEENGARFYRRAAELQAEKQNTAFLETLAAMEDGHKATFAAMRKDLPEDLKEQTAFDPYMEATLYLNALAASHGGEGTTDAVAALSGKESMLDILRTAIGLEQKSIIFYIGLKDLVPENLGKDKVDAIIDEEKSHIVTLAAELKKLV